MIQRKKKGVIILRWIVSESSLSQYTNDNGVYQDGTLAFCRDKDGVLWALLGHSHLGGVSLWKGTSVDDMQKQCYIEYNFHLGEAGKAFDGTFYPDGPRSRGQIWPYGLWIDPEDGRFYCFIHNETGWGAKETSYTVFGLNEGEPDFRHIGLMTSDDQGKSWDFRGWIITSNKPCWSEHYRPDGMQGGQRGRDIFLCAGDFTLYVNHKDGYFYIFYTQIEHNIDTKSCYDRIYAARAPIESKGLPGSWKKLYNGSFSEPGNMGKESPVVENANVPCISYNYYLNKYIMTSYRRDCWVSGKGACQVAFSDDLVNWSKPELLAPDRKDLSKPYFTICNTEKEGMHNETGKTFRLFMESNGTDVEKADVTICLD